MKEEANGIASLMNHICWNLLCEINTLLKHYLIAAFCSKAKPIYKMFICKNQKKKEKHEKTFTMCDKNEKLT